MTGRAERARLLRTLAAAALVIALAASLRWLSHSELVAPHRQINALLELLRVFLYTGLIFFWGATAGRRVIQIQVRRYLIAAAGIMVFWLVIRELRWHVILGEDARRWLWYAYYIPLLIVPLIALLVSLSLGRPETYRLPRWTAALYVPTAALIALVLTNDLHQRVFVFPAGPAAGELDYRYGWCFFVLAACAALCAAAAFAVMLGKCRVPRTGRILWLPLLPYGAAVLYVILYALRVPFITGPLGDLSVFTCLAYAAFFECCIRSGLIQSNARYFDLFVASVGISAQIVDRDTRVRYAARGARPIRRDDMLRAETGPVILEGGLRLHSLPVSGGRAVWTEDVSELLDLRETLEARQEELTERNALLQLEYEREREHQIVAAQDRLYDLLQTKTQRQLDEIERLTQEWTRCCDSEARRRLLGRIVLLGTYVKRRRDLILSLDASPAVPESKLLSAFAESFRALGLLGVRGGARVETGRDALPGEALALAYDFFEDTAEAAADAARYLNVQVCPVGGVLRVSIWTDARDLPAAELARRFPGARSLDEEDGTQLLLALEGGGEG